MAWPGGRHRPTPPTGPRWRCRSPPHPPGPVPLTALGLRATVTDLGLEFLPLTWESYDVALAGAALGAPRPIVTAVTDPDISMIGGYDLTDAGTFHPVDASPSTNPGHLTTDFPTAPAAASATANAGCR